MQHERLNKRAVLCGVVRLNFPFAENVGDVDADFDETLGEGSVRRPS